MNSWMRDNNKMREQSIVYRMPLDGSDSAPTALRVAGSPVDQFSFLESDDHHLNVLVRSDTSGDGMWGAEVAAGDLALMRAPPHSFSARTTPLPPPHHPPLPKPTPH